MSNIEVDWDTVKRKTDADTDKELQDLTRQAHSNAAAVAYRVKSMIETAAKNKEAFIDWMGEVQTQNMKNINKAVDDYQSHIDLARFVRDKPHCLHAWATRLLSIQLVLKIDQSEGNLLPHTDTKVSSRPSSNCFTPLT